MDAEIWQFEVARNLWGQKLQRYLIKFTSLAEFRYLSGGMFSSYPTPTAAVFALLCRLVLLFNHNLFVYTIFARIFHNLPVIQTILFYSYNAEKVKTFSLQLKQKGRKSGEMWLISLKRAILMEIFVEGFAQIRTDKRSKLFWKIFLWLLEFGESHVFIICISLLLLQFMLSCHLCNFKLFLFNFHHYSSRAIICQ